VWTGVGAWGDFERAKEIASEEGRTLIDIRSSPFTYCGCGELFDFTKKLLNAPLLAAGMDEASWRGLDARCQDDLS
jgi:hypothetical protein